MSNGKAEREAGEALHRQELGRDRAVREAGSPQATPVWIDYDGQSVLVNSAHGRTNVKNIERDPRATVTVLPAENQQSGFVMVSGPAELVDAGARDHVDKLAKN
jgi:general stress protein 26